MAQRIPIQLHVANALQWLGTLYRNPAEAIKEHVSNAIDEHLKAKLAGTAHDHCDVMFTLDRKHVTIDYPYGMSRKEFESALQRVADSAKRATGVGTIGRLGIGIFSFQQIGKRCTFLSRKTVASETLRVVLKEASDEATLETALAREALPRPGLRVIITELKFDPTRSRGPLAPDTLRRYLAEKFESYLREGWLRITIRAGIGEFVVTAARVQLPRLLADLGRIAVGGDPRRAARLDLYFDPTGRGRVSIRHRGVVVIEDVSALAAYGLEDSAWAQGHVRGTIDADFLTPLPARSGFDENEEWIALLDALDKYLPTLDDEIATHLSVHRAKEAGVIGERALRLARDILDLDEFRDLALPGGLAKRGRPAPPPMTDSERPSRKRRAARNGPPKRSWRYRVAARPAHRLRGSAVRARIAGSQPLHGRRRRSQHAPPRLPECGQPRRLAPRVCGADDRQGIDRLERPERHRRRLPRKTARLLLQAARPKIDAGTPPPGYGRGTGPARSGVERVDRPRRGARQIPPEDDPDRHERAARSGSWRRWWDSEALGERRNSSNVNPYNRAPSRPRPYRRRRAAR